MTSTPNQIYDFICFTDLAYEFDYTDKKVIEKKIKRRLRYHKLGAYNQSRVEYIRSLKNELQSEISSREKSRFFHKIESHFAELNDYDVKAMTAHFHQTYNTFNKDELLAMINFSVYLYHLR